jgi:hypothetical protein
LLSSGFQSSGRCSCEPVALPSLHFGSSCRQCEHEVVFIAPLPLPPMHTSICTNTTSATPMPTPCLHPTLPATFTSICNHPFMLMPQPFAPVVPPVPPRVALHHSPRGAHIRFTQVHFAVSLGVVLSLPWCTCATRTCRCLHAGVPVLG